MGGGSTKSNNHLHCTFTDYVRQRLGVGRGDRLPPYDTSPQPTANGRVPLRINWSRPYGPNQDSLTIADFLSSTELRENEIVAAYTVQIGQEEATKVCRQSFDRMVHTWREEQRKSKDQK